MKTRNSTFGRKVRDAIGGRGLLVGLALAAATVLVAALVVDSTSIISTSVTWVFVGAFVAVALPVAIGAAAEFFREHRQGGHDRKENVR